MVQTVTSHREISLDSKRYKLIGPVTITMPDPFAEKTVLGDFTQESLRRRNVIRWSDFSGGMGLEVVSPQDGPVDLTRVYWSDCHLFERGHVTLGKGSTAQTGGPSGIHQAYGFFNGQMYLVGASGDVYRTSTSSDNLTDTTHDVTNTTVDTVSGRINGSDYIIWGQDGSGYEFSTDGASYTTGGREGHFLVIWDDRLWGFDVDDHQLWFALAPSNTAGDHTNDAILPAEIGTALGMFTGPDADGNDIIYVLTAENGLWAHDAANNRFIRTLFRQVVPVKRDASELPRDYHVRPVVWQGAIYIPIGLNVWEYHPVAGTIRSIGPFDDNHKLPTLDLFGGPIRTLVASDDAVFAINDLSQSEETVGNVGILEWNGHAWQSFHTSVQDASPGASSVSFAMVVGIQQKTATHEYRLWATTLGSTELFWNLPMNSKSPKQTTTWIYGTNLGSRSRISFPWVDGGTDSETFALRVKVDALDLDSSNEIEVQYKTNFTTRTVIETSTALASGASALDTSGISVLTFPDNGTSEEGVLFRFIQLQVLLTQGTSGESPDLNSFEFEWFRKGTIKLTFDFEIDMRTAYANTEPTTQFFNFMNTLKNATTLLELTWKDTSVTQQSITRTYYTTITALEMREENEPGGVMRVRAEEV